MENPQRSNYTGWALALLALLMTAHLGFLGFRDNPKNAPDDFQEAAETYVAVILALMAPLSIKK